MYVYLPVFHLKPNEEIMAFYKHLTRSLFAQDVAKYPIVYHPHIFTCT